MHVYTFADFGNRHRNYRNVLSIGFFFFHFTRFFHFHFCFLSLMVFIFFLNCFRFFQLFSFFLPSFSVFYCFELPFAFYQQLYHGFFHFHWCTWCATAWSTNQRTSSVYGIVYLGSTKQTHQNALISVFF